MPQWPWTLCFLGADDTWWDSFEIWGRWTEGPIVRLVRECTDIAWKTLRETWGTRELFAENGCEIDYRLGGIFMKTDGSPRFIFVYDETNTDPKMKIYSKAPDDYEQENFEQEIENRFLEEEARRNERREGRARAEGKGQPPPAAPHILGYKKLPYRRSYKHLRCLHDDRNEYFHAFIAHAAQKMEFRARKGEGKGKKGDGKGEGKGDGGKGWGKGDGGKDAAAGAAAASAQPAQPAAPPADQPQPQQPQGGKAWLWGNGQQGQKGQQGRLWGEQKGQKGQGQKGKRAGGGKKGWGGY